MSEIINVDIQEINDSFDIYYSGWSEEELSELKNNYQSTYFGSLSDVRLEIVTSDGDLYYAIFRSGESFKQQSQFILNNEKSILIVNANGNIYRFDTANQKCLDNSCYSSVLFDNVNQQENDSPYLATAVSSELGIMVVIDQEGVAAITYDKVLWKLKLEYAYADYAKVISVSKSQIIIDYEPPDRNKEVTFLNPMTGEKL